MAALFSVLHSSPLDRILGSLSNLCLLKYCSSPTLLLRLQFPANCGFLLDVPPTSQSMKGQRTIFNLLGTSLFQSHPSASWLLKQNTLSPVQAGGGLIQCSPPHLPQSNQHPPTHTHSPNVLHPCCLLFSQPSFSNSVLCLTCLFFKLSLAWVSLISGKLPSFPCLKKPQFSHISICVANAQDKSTHKEKGFTLTRGFKDSVHGNL